MVYFDNSATTRPDEEVLTSFVETNRRFFANPASIHGKGREAEALLDRSRDQIRSLLGLQEGEVIFTSGGTEANNLAIIGFAYAHQSRGSHIITTAIEHPSVLNACHFLERNGFEVDYLAVDEQGRISLDELGKLLRRETTVVSIMHVNNEIGTIQPIEQAVDIVHRNSRAVFHSDCVQSFGKLPVLLQENGPDAITVSAHKINGLKNSGILALKKGVMPTPINFGGGQEKGVRSGTVSVPNAVAAAKAMRLSVVDRENETYRMWRNRLIQYVTRYDGVNVISPPDGAPHIVSIAFSKIKGEVAVNYFQEHGIFLSTSSACSSKSTNAGHVIEAIHLDHDYKFGVVRISFGKDNTEEDIKKFEDVFSGFMKLLGRELNLNGME
ncbi:cysteine desulfurase family protein [Sporosarcina sp. Te-1]|uniref:cysteine desulfurase family protein n=1 Tax=Sporosarcina sp. Te-1 TaxID=2818390 RepID=UPI001A9F2004|nr:cysteine desulfurase family protein [Sporosarcina sp. Te-1]QTD41414.1 cysteine desulfurase [Sporosarcina sp. Te-1]